MAKLNRNKEKYIEKLSERHKVNWENWNSHFAVVWPW